jgi:hypothetical protein
VPTHLQVEDNACGARNELFAEKFLWRRISADLVIMGTKQAAEGTAHTKFIVDHVHDGFVHQPTLQRHSTDVTMKSRLYSCAGVLASYPGFDGVPGVHD